MNRHSRLASVLRTVQLTLRVATVFGLLSPSIGMAELNDRPPQLVAGKPTFHVFTALGVLRDELDAVFFCTSLEPTNTIRVAVELFNYTGDSFNDVTTGNGAFDLLPGRTVTFATANTVAFAEDKVINMALIGDTGSARILSTSKKIICSAVLTDGSAAPPQSTISLRLIKNQNQNGD